MLQKKNGEMVCLEFWGDENHIKEGNMEPQNTSKDEAGKVVEVSSKAHNLLGSVMVWMFQVPACQISVELLWNN